MDLSISYNNDHLSLSHEYNQNCITSENIMLEHDDKLISSFDSGPSQITENIFLGDLSGCNSAFFLEKNIKAVLQIMPNPPPITDNISHMHIDILDRGDVDIIDIINCCYSFIEYHEQQNNKIYIHCAMGISRSASVVIGYLMKKNKMKYNDTYNFVQSKRPQIEPNFGFCCQLMQFEQTLDL